MITHWKIDNYVLISLKMHGSTFMNASDNVLKIVTVENSAKLP